MMHDAVDHIVTTMETFFTSGNRIEPYFEQMITNDENSGE